MPDVHAKFSPSASDRLIHCPPSLMLGEQYGPEDTGSEYSREGTEAHSLGEFLLKQALGLSCEDPRSSLKMYSPEMQECAEGYRDTVLELYETVKQKCQDAIISVEQQVSFEEYVAGGFGTSDCIILGDGHMYVIDYKHGKGVEVSAEDNEVWNPGSIDGVIENERHCGDVRARKTYTPDFKTHKSEKNRQNRKQYIQRNHHEAIVDREVYNAANLLKSSHQYAAKNRPLPTLSVIDGGVLSGYVPVDKNWTGFSTEEYRAACESVGTEKSETSVQGKRLYMGGYEVVRADYFPSNERPAMTITNGKLRFNTACLKKFEDVEYVELLLNTVKNCIAIRPCEKDNPNAIHWGQLREERWVVNTLSCRGLAQTLFDMMSWEDEGQYRFSGEFKVQGNNKLLLFELGEPVITKTVEQIVVPEEAEENEDPAEAEREEIVIREKVRVYPLSWATSFGVPVSYLEQHHYSGEWDVLRPAKELEDMNTITADRLAALMKEAETIMEGWTKTA